MKWFSQKGEKPRVIPSRLDRDPEYVKWKHLEPDIEFLVIVTETFIVYVDRAIDVDWSYRGASAEKGPTDTPEFNGILNRVAALETRPCDEIGRNMKLHYKRLICEGIARALDHDFNGANVILDSAAAYIEARSQETSRYWYLSASALTTAPFVLIACAFWYWRDDVQASLSQIAFLEVLSACAGALGALLSVIGRTGRQHYDCAAGRRLHYLEASSRIWAGAISGVLVGLAVFAGLFLTAVAHDSNLPAIMIIAALSSGLSERLAVSIIADLGASKTQEGKEKSL